MLASTQPRYGRARSLGVPALDPSSEISKSIGAFTLLEHHAAVEGHCPGSWSEKARPEKRTNKALSRPNTIIGIRAHSHYSASASFMFTRNYPDVARIGSGKCFFRLGLWKYSWNYYE